MIYENIDDSWGRYLTCGICEPDSASRALFKFQQCIHIIEAIDRGKDTETTDYSVGSVHSLRATHSARKEVKELPFLGWTRIVIMNDIAGYKPISMQHVRSTGLVVTRDLGMLGPDEGRLVASRAIMDYVLSECHPDETWGGDIKTKCPSTFHRVPQERFVAAQNFGENPDMKMMMLASMILEGSCIFCVMESHSDNNFGLDDDFGQPDKKTGDLLAKIREQSRGGL